MVCTIAIPSPTTSGASVDKELSKQLKHVFETTRNKCISTCVYYGGSKDTLDIRHLEKLDRILDAGSLQEATAFAKRAEDSVFMTCLTLWSQNKIRGPNTVSLWETKASKAESLARYFDKQSKDKFVVCTPGASEKMLAKAEKQRMRAEKLRAYAAQLAKDPLAPEPSFEADESEETPSETPAPKKTREKKQAVAEVKSAPRKKVVGFASKRRKKSA